MKPISKASSGDYESGYVPSDRWLLSSMSIRALTHAYAERPSTSQVFLAGLTGRRE